MEQEGPREQGASNESDSSCEQDRRTDLKSEAAAQRLERAEEARAQGVATFARGDFPGALNLFSTAIALAPSNAVLFSNRAAVLLEMRRNAAAMKDAQEAVRLDPSLAKATSLPPTSTPPAAPFSAAAHYRLGKASEGLGRTSAARSSYQAALGLIPPEDAKNVNRLLPPEDAKNVKKVTLHRGGGSPLS
ncbi:hypothetical protein T484DRAFT_1902969 [Baffinella frigidus]|nr:hypothetical protein T484DRAFT_1902969 [Cryptophyta sp. CCMP2293]